MNPTPTVGSATPSGEGGEPGDVVVPAPRSGAYPLPRRARRGDAARDGAPEAEPARDPDGRRYADADAATLDRLLSGLRDI